MAMIWWVVLTFCRFAQNLYVSKYGFRQEEWSANQGNPFGNLNTPRPGKSFNADGLCYSLLKQLYLFLVTCRLERAQAGKGPRPVCFVNSSRTEKRTQKEASRGLQDEKRDYHAC